MAAQRRRFTTRNQAAAHRRLHPAPAPRLLAGSWRGDIVMGVRKTIIRTGLETLYFSGAHMWLRPFVGADAAHERPQPHMRAAEVQRLQSGADDGFPDAHDDV